MTDIDESQQQPASTDDAEADVEPEVDPDAGDAFEGWPAAESASVIEEIPADVSVEHVRGEIDVPDGYTVLEGAPLGDRRSVGVVVSRFNGGVTNLLLRRALEALTAAGVSNEGITVLPVPGRVRAAARCDGAGEDAALRLHRRARRDRARRDAALRLCRAPNAPPGCSSRGSRPACRSRSAC